jgi:hypothetical protein
MLYIMRVRGHKSITSTLLCIQMESYYEELEYVSKVATNTAEACKLIEDGFAYVTKNATTVAKS